MKIFLSFQSTWIVQLLNDNNQHADKHVISPVERGWKIPECLLAGKNCLGCFPGFPKEKSLVVFLWLVLLVVNGEQIAEAVPLMSVQGPDTFDLLKKQTSF